MTTKEKLVITFKDLLKVYLVYLFFDIVWPDSDMKNIDVTAKLFFQHNFKRFMKFGIPTFLSVRLYFFINRDKYDL